MIVPCDRSLVAYVVASRDAVCPGLTPPGVADAMTACLEPGILQSFKLSMYHNRMRRRLNGAAKGQHGSGMKQRWRR